MSGSSPTWRAWWPACLRPGWINSLALKLMTLTAPGVPDLYQGSELWDLSLVDPDNRRPVDFDQRRRSAGRAARGGPGGHVGGRGRARSEQVAGVSGEPCRPAAPTPPASAITGSYEPLVASGPAGDHVVAFARGGRVVTVAPRLPIGLERIGGWGATTVRLPNGRVPQPIGRGATGVVRAGGVG